MATRQHNDDPNPEDRGQEAVVRAIPYTDAVRERIGHFKVTKRLGEGGMGIVFAALDERLGRTVAIKMLRQADQTETRERFWREARAAAALSHPNICQIHDVGEIDGELYIAMELLEGESLAERLAQGPLSLQDAGQIALEVLGALEALHRQQIVHRDLKPSNIHLTPHGVKLLDFGLARPFTQEISSATLTRTNVVVGTPRYMAPEQWKAEPIDSRADLFALGAVLYEMLTGSPAFPGVTAAEIRHEVLFENPPALAGPAAVAAVDRVVRKALSKRPADREVDASAMARKLREALIGAADANLTKIRAVTRLLVLPFKMLRPDEECDFLSHSLPDAITASLAGFDSLLVRSPWMAAKYELSTPDNKQIFQAADVDMIVVGTILRGGDSLRVTAQLLEAPEGTTLWSKTHQSPVGDVFELQDSLARQIVESLSLPLGGREAGTLQRDVPGSAKAYELYLRANEIGRAPDAYTIARDLYLESLKLDPQYAPAWAELGRIYRLIGKYEDNGTAENDLRAADALERALQLNPDLTRAQSYQAAFDVERGRSLEVLEQLLRRYQLHRYDPDLLSSLVHVCRYVGLLQASVAAHEEAKRLDSNVRTSAMYTYWMVGQHERALEESTDQESYLHFYSLISMGRHQEAIEGLKELEGRVGGTRLAIWRSQRYALEGKKEKVIASLREVLDSNFRDPEGLYYIARTAAHVGEKVLALETLEGVVAGGFYCDRTMAHDPWMAPIRNEPAFMPIYRAAEAGRRKAAQIYYANEGDKLLGVNDP